MLQQEGRKQHDIAAALRVAARVVSQRLKRAHEQEVEALRRHPALGRQSWLTPEQLAQVPARVEHGTEGYGRAVQLVLQQWHPPLPTRPPHTWSWMTLAAPHMLRSASGLGLGDHSEVDGLVLDETVFEHQRVDTVRDAASGGVGGPL